MVVEASSSKPADPKPLKPEPVPWVNQRDTGAPLLERDKVIHASEPNHAPRVEVKKRRRWSWR